jgi:hypothetical protein
MQEETQVPRSARFGALSSAEDDEVVLPVAGVVVMEDVGRGKGDDPEAADEAADGEDPAAEVAVIRGETGGFAGGKDLTTDTDGDEESAENKREPCHG